MHHDSPPPSWYEPADLIEDDELEMFTEPEPLVISHGIVTWRCTPPHHGAPTPRP